MSSRPVGAFVIKDGDVRCPSIDVKRLIPTAQVVAIAALFTVRAIVKARAKRG